MGGRGCGLAPLSPFFVLSPQPRVAFKMATLVLVAAQIGTLSSVALGEVSSFVVIFAGGRWDVP